MNNLANLSRWATKMSLSDSSHVNMFMFPYAGGSAHAYSSWRAHFSKLIDLYSVQLPGRSRLASISMPTDLPSLVTMFYENLKPLFFQKPIVMYGHSFGALIAFELTKKLIQEGANIEKLIVSGCAAPSIIHEYGPIHTLSRAALIARMKQMGGTPDEIFDNEDVLNCCLDVLRADLTVFHTYDYQRTKVLLQCPIMAIAGREDDFASYNRMVGWASETMNDSELHALSGDHFLIENNKDVFLQLVADAVY